MQKITIPWIAAGNIGLYFLANAFKALLPFFILPLLTRYIAPAEYGLWGIYSALLALAAPVTALGLTMIVGRSYQLKTKIEHASITYMAMVLTAAASVILFFVVSAIDIVADRIFSIPVSLLYILPFLCLFQNFDYLNKIILRHERRVKLYVALELSSALVFRIGGLLAILYVSANWSTLLYTQLISAALFFFIGLWLMVYQSHINPKWNPEEARDMMRMGLPLVPHALGGIIMVLCDRIILERMMGVEVVGVYTIAATIGGSILIFCTAFNNEWGPWMNRELKDGSHAKKLKIVKYTYLYFALVIFAAISISFVSYFYITYFLDKTYAGAFEIALWLTAGSAVFGMSYAITHYLIVLGRTRVLPLITGFSAILNIGLTVLLVHLNGQVGAAQATLLAYIVFFVALLWQSQKNYPMPWLLTNEPSAKN